MLAVLPAIYMVGEPDADKVTREHVLNQVATLTHASTVIAESVQQGTLKVVPALYDVATGLVSFLPERAQRA